MIFARHSNTIDRSKMFDILRAYGILEKIVKMFAIMHDNTTARVVSSGSNTDYLEILSADLGDTLAPFLFIMIVDYVLTKAAEDYEDLGFTLVETRSRRYPPQRITDTEFADNIATLSDTL